MIGMLVTGVAMVCGLMFYVVDRNVTQKDNFMEIGGFFNTEAFELYRVRQEAQGKMFKSHMDGLSVIVKALGNVAKTVAGAR
jgi:hypothetical protein